MTSHRNVSPLPPTRDLTKGTYSFYEYVRLLSLDVVFGALSMMYLFVYCSGYPISWPNYLVLGLTVWLIYTLDHLWDAYKIPHEAHTPRHLFHQKYFLPLAGVWIFILTLNSVCAFWFLDPKTLYYGFVVSVLVSLHFLLGAIEGLRSVLFFQKETRIALVYTLGVSTAPFSLVLPQLGHSPELWLLAMLCFCLAWANLLIISHYEHEIDTQDAHVSMVRSLGLAKSQKLIRVIFGIFGALMLFAFYFNPLRHWIALLCLLLMGFILFRVFQGGAYFLRRENYRAWSDAIFYLPALLVFLGNGSGF